MVLADSEKGLVCAAKGVKECKSELTPDPSLDLSREQANKINQAATTHAHNIITKG